MVMALSNSFLDFVLEPTEHEIIYKDYVRGPFTIKQVPYEKYSGLGPDGKDAYIPGDVMLNLCDILTEMYNSGIYETKYTPL